MIRIVRLTILLVSLVALRPALPTARPVQASRLPQESSCLPAVPARSGGFAQLVRAQNTFGFRLLRSLLGPAPSANSFISPTSVSIALAMAYDGARGSTANALAGGLGLSGLSRTAVRQQAGALLHRLNTSGSGVGLSVADSLWAREGTTFRAAFLHHARDDYGAPARVLNFDAPSAPATINSWVACATKGKIPSIISGIRPEEVMFLINAVYFHGDWEQPFEPSATHTRTFTTARGAHIEVPLMSRLGTYAYKRGSNFQAVRLLYGNSRFSMVIVLPESGVALPAFTRSMNASAWSHWTAGMQSQPGTLQIPRFSLKNAFQLNQSLVGMGMGKAFSRSADFSGLCVQRCFLTEVRHKTYLAVNEKGTVAAAATSVGVGSTAMPVAKFTMVVDHPFFVSIQDSVTHAVLFTGLVADPA